MITLKTPQGDFGPFVTAYPDGDRWICDGIIYPKSVVGGGELVQGAPAPGPGAPAASAIDELAAQYLVAVQAELDRVARGYGYDNMTAAVTYAEEPAVPRFQAEGQALRAWRSLVWEACYAMLAAVRAGDLAVPTEAEVLAALPAAPVQALP